MKITTALVLCLLVPLTATANSNKKKMQEQDQYQRQSQRQSQGQRQSAVGSGNTTSYRSEYEEAAQTAYAPGGVLGKCLAAYGVGIQSRSFGITFGANRARKACEERELAMLLWEIGEKEKGRLILVRQFDEMERKRKPKYVCKLPIEEHCNTVTSTTDRDPR